MKEQNKLKLKAEKELAERLREAHANKQKEIQERIEGLEVVPNANRIIIMPYAENPLCKSNDWFRHILRHIWGRFW